uniref:Toxin candidate TRINITY_DN28326_c0_g1_i2.p1 n=1 Tax=Pachycerianthus borealis TaxID=2736680 RepID=A0A7G7WYU9_9CNID|nr:toxin candidate TRINITY_DN28326_c0_g1_i2.p1 [Pachycerianthus borealis]
MKTVYMVLLLAMMILQVEGCCNCNSGEVCFRCHCYRINWSTTSWKQARKNCVRSGGDLASILYPEEQNFILGHVNTINSLYGYRVYWIGANDLIPEGTYKWSDGSIYSYSKYIAFNTAANDCMRLHSNGYWYMYPCSTTDTRYICKRKCRCV